MLINTTSFPQTIKLVLASGAKDSINLQPNSRAVPPPGAVIDPKHYGRYLGSIKGLPGYAAPAQVPSTAPVESD